MTKKQKNCMENLPLLISLNPSNPDKLISKYDQTPSKDFSVDYEIIRSHLGIIEGEVEFIKKLLK